MTERQLFSSGGKWEPIVGYSRAVKVGNRVYVAGTTATDAKGQIVGPDDPYTQTIQTLANIERALTMTVFKQKHAIRTRIFFPHNNRSE